MSPGKRRPTPNTRREDPSSALSVEDSWPCTGSAERQKSPQVVRGQIRGRGVLVASSIPKGTDAAQQLLLPSPGARTWWAQSRTASLHLSLAGNAEVWLKGELYSWRMAMTSGMIMVHLRIFCFWGGE